MLEIAPIPERDEPPQENAVGNENEAVLHSEEIDPQDGALESPLVNSTVPALRHRVAITIHHITRKESVAWLLPLMPPHGKYTRYAARCGAKDSVSNGME